MIVSTSMAPNGVNREAREAAVVNKGCSEMLYFTRTVVSVGSAEHASVDEMKMNGKTYGV